MEISIVRHAQSANNVAERALYDDEGDHLTELGKLQAHRLGEWFREFRQSPETVYCSPTQRSEQTLRLGFPEMEYRVDIRLNEQNIGDFSPYDSESSTDVFAKYVDSYWADIRFVPPNGESIRQHYQRVGAFLEEHMHGWLEERNNILIVCHGGTQRLIRVWMESIPESALSRFFSDDSWDTPNCQVIVYSEGSHQTHKSIRNLESVASFSPFTEVTTGFPWTSIAPLQLRGEKLGFELETMLN